MCVCACVCMCRLECVLRCSPEPVLSVEVFSWQRLPADLSVLVSLQGCEMTHHRAHLGPHHLFQQSPSLVLPDHVFFFSLALYSLATPLSLTLFTLSHRTNCSLSFFPPETYVSCLDRVCKASEKNHLMKCERRDRPLFFSETTENVPGIGTTYLNSLSCLLWFLAVFDAFLLCIK